MQSGSSDGVVPLPGVVADNGGVCLHGIFEEIIQDEQVDAVSGEGSLSADS